MTVHTCENKSVRKHSSFLRNLPPRVRSSLVVLWLLTESDLETFIGPTTAFGICSALLGPLLATLSPGSPAKPRISGVLARLPLVILFNWSNLLVLDLVYQRLPDPARDDAVNKSRRRRPVARGPITPEQIRSTAIYTIPLVIALNHFLLDVGAESIIISVLGWLYNDLWVGHQDFVARNSILAAGFWMFNIGSVKVAAGISITRNGGIPSSGLATRGLVWVSLISLIIFTTVKIRGLKDQEGGRARSRRSAPIVFGDGAARWMIAVPTAFSSCFCAWYWSLESVSGILQIVLGGVVTARCLTLSGFKSDKTARRVGRLWMAMLYTLLLSAKYRLVIW